MKSGRVHTHPLGFKYDEVGYVLVPIAESTFISPADAAKLRARGITWVYALACFLDGEQVYLSKF